MRQVIEVRQTRNFVDWRAGLRDAAARKRIGARIDRLAFGNFGDAKSVGGKVFELRLDFGPGYRIYFVRHGDTIVILLCGGDKDSQVRDIETARVLAKALGDEG